MSFGASFGVLCLAVLAQAAGAGAARDRAEEWVPTDPEIRLSAADLALWQSPEFQKKLTESYLGETEIEPSVTAQEREKMLKVLGLISADKMEEAARTLQKETKEASSAVFDFTLANIYYQKALAQASFEKEQLEPATAGYERAVTKYPKFRRAWKNLGLIHVRSGQFDQAIPALTRVVELGGGDALTYGLLGYAYSSVENHLSAESAYRTALLLDPATLDWKMGLARSFFKQERYPEAVSLCGRLIAEDPNRAELWLLQANAYLGLNQPLKAAVNYEIVERLGKSSVDSLNMLADIYVNEDLSEMAVATYTRGLQKDASRSIERALRAAKVLVSRGAVPETRHLLERIETLGGGSLSKDQRKDLLKLRVRIVASEGSGAPEITLLEQIVALDPLDGEALILLGQYHARLGEHEKAIFHYERAQSLEKSEADAKVRHAQLLVSQGKYTEALPLLRRAQEIKPRDDVQKYLDQVERIAKTK